MTAVETLAGAGFQMTTGAAPAPENPDKWRRHLPRYFCAACDVGQSIPNCWLCAEPCQLTRSYEKKADGSDRFSPGSEFARQLPGASPWKPKDETEETA